MLATTFYHSTVEGFRRRRVKEKERISTESSRGSRRGFTWAAVLDCLLNIIRALKMGSCLSSDQGRGWSYSPASQGSPRWLRRNLTRKFGSRGSSSLDPKRDEMLQGIPGRMCVNGASPSVSMFTQQGKKGTNQDAMIFWENFGSREDTVFCGVFDGHGPLGHIVAREVRDALPLKLNDHWTMIAGQNDSTENGSKRSTDSEEMASPCSDEKPMPSNDYDEKEQHPQMFDILKQSFQQAYRIMDNELRVHQHIDCFCSGTTAVTLLKQGQNLVIGNLGDSRAILGTRDENRCLNAVQLTVDLKPSLSREAERIRRCRGRVFALRDEPDVARVWLPNNDSPGLAMARAFGDFCLKDFGLISVPDISYRQLTERDEFIVLATDGIWDVLSNEEVVDIVASSPTRSSAARAMVQSAVRAWRCKYPTSKVDDCAVICLFLDADQSKSIASFTENKDPVDMLKCSSSENTETSSLIELKRSRTVRTSCDVILNESKKTPRKTTGSNSTADMTDAEDWSALEGVSRVNTLLTLPRFIAGGEKEVVNSKLKK